MAQAHGASGELYRDLERLQAVGTVAGQTDAELLRRFAGRRDDAAEAAFHALVTRHGPMVRGVCRQILRDPGAADDAFQATFLVLVRKAGRVRVQGSLGPWLYGVASRVARKARTGAYRRRRREEEAGAVAETVGPSGEAAAGAAEAVALLHEEVGRLPDRYRSPVVLCHLQGLSHEEAARELRCPVGTVSGRLSRARDLLRTRLVRRGVGASAAAAAWASAGEASAAPLPAVLVGSTARAAATVAAGGALTGAVGVLAQEALGAMVWNKVRVGMLAAAGLAAAGLAGGYVTGQVPGGAGGGGLGPAGGSDPPASVGAGSLGGPPAGFGGLGGPPTGGGVAGPGGIPGEGGADQTPLGGPAPKDGGGPAGKGGMGRGMAGGMPGMAGGMPGMGGMGAGMTGMGMMGGMAPAPTNFNIPGFPEYTKRLKESMNGVGGMGMMMGGGGGALPMPLTGVEFTPVGEMAGGGGMMGGGMMGSGGPRAPAMMGGAMAAANPTGGVPAAGKAEVHRAGGLVYVLGPDGKTANGFSLAEGAWSRYPIPDGVQILPFSGNQLLALAFSGKKVDELAVLDKRGGWHVHKLKTPASGEVIPVLLDRLVYYRTGRDFYTYSPSTHRWDELHLAGKDQPEILPGSGSDALLVQQGETLYVYSVELGRWSEGVAVKTSPAPAKGGGRAPVEE